MGTLRIRIRFVPHGTSNSRLSSSRDSVDAPARPIATPVTTSAIDRPAKVQDRISRCESSVADDNTDGSVSRSGVRSLPSHMKESR